MIIVIKYLLPLLPFFFQILCLNFSWKFGFILRFYHKLWRSKQRRLFLMFRFGRKVVLFPSITMVILAGFASAFVPEFWVFFTLRLLIGVFEGGVMLTLFVMASELVGPKYRSITSTQQWFAFTLALCIMGLLAWLVPKWRMLEIILTIPYIFVLVFYRFLFLYVIFKFFVLSLRIVFRTLLNICDGTF